MTEPSPPAPSFTFTFTERELVFLINAFTDPTWFEGPISETYIANTRTNLLKRFEKAYSDD